MWVLYTAVLVLRAFSWFNTQTKKLNKEMLKQRESQTVRLFVYWYNVVG